MTELYALPDHEVVRASLPDIERHVVPTDEAVERINSNIGIVPLAISHEDGGRIYWGDIGQYPFAEWQYIFTVDKLAREGAIADPFVTEIDILKRDDLATDGIYPSGFVFHISRCGSTLTGKALARTPRHLVLNR